MGIIALSLPFVTSLIASSQLSSISASYYTEARNAFVGQLFVVGAFFLAYNGHTRRQGIFARLAALTAILVATCPTACDGCVSSSLVYVHYASAVSLFSILAYFCLGPFRIKKEDDSVKRQRRRVIYLICGLTMVASMVLGGILQLSLSEASIAHYRVTYWVETVSLLAFGVAWITAGKYLKPLVDQEDALKLFKH